MIFYNPKSQLVRQLVYQVCYTRLSFVLLMVNRTCTKILQSTKILWPGLLTVVDVIESKLYTEHLVMHRRRPQKTYALELNLPSIHNNIPVVCLLKDLHCWFVTSALLWKLNTIFKFFTCNFKRFVFSTNVGRLFKESSSYNM